MDRICRWRFLTRAGLVELFPGKVRAGGEEKDKHTCSFVGSWGVGCSFRTLPGPYLGGSWHRRSWFCQLSHNFWALFLTFLSASNLWKGSLFQARKISPRNSAEIIQTICGAAEQEHCQSLMSEVGQEIQNMPQAHRNLQWLKQLRFGFYILYSFTCSDYYHGEFKFIESQSYWTIENTHNIEPVHKEFPFLTCVDAVLMFMGWVQIVLWFSLSMTFSLFTFPSVFPVVISNHGDYCDWCQVE